MQALVFSHMALSCNTPLAVEQFYTRHFGFQRARVVPLGNGQQIVFLKREDIHLELFPAGQPRTIEPTGGSGPEYAGWRHLAFQVEDVDATLAAMGQDARVTLGPLNFDAVIPGWRTVWVADPEDNIVEISQGYIDAEETLSSQTGGDRAVARGR